MSSVISDETVVVRSSEPVSAPVADGLVLFSVEQGKYYDFNEVATAVWTELAVPTSVARLCDTLVARYDVGGRECRDDVLALLREWHARTLVAIVPSDASGA
jgi:hypothetical protein